MPYDKQPLKDSCICPTGKVKHCVTTACRVWKSRKSEETQGKKSLSSNFLACHGSIILSNEILSVENACISVCIR